jgi:hypothetical protein
LIRNYTYQAAYVHRKAYGDGTGVRKHIVLILLILLLTLAPALAAADTANNNITVLKPYAYGGSYGTGKGQIDTPVSVKADSGDNIYILQRVHLNEKKYRSSIAVYDKNLTFKKSFEVLKMSIVDVGWDRAGGGFYYDDLASAFDIDRNGTIYVLCGWDVVVLDKNGKYQYQFPVSAFMGWIDSTSGDTQFYYPHGLVVTDDGYVVITSGSTPQKHEIIFIYPEGKLFTRLETSVRDMNDIARDRNGSLYTIEAGNNVVRVYDPTITKEMDMSLYFNGTYNGSPSYLAFLSGGNVTASANGIFIYNKNGTVSAHFMDNNQSLNNVSWNRPIAVNSTDCLIVVSGMRDSGKTPRPILVYRYSEGAVVGAPEEYDVCGSALGAFGLVAILYFCIRRF